MKNLIADRWQKYNFLFEQLVARDFKQRYKRTYLGIVWSLLSPLLHLAVMVLVFVNFFGRTIPHFVVYVFIGLKVFTFFKEATTRGMSSLVANRNILTKIKAPKYLFLLSKNVASLLNFGLMLIILFAFVLIDGVPIHPRFILIVYPIFTLLLFNIGVGLILSALYVFFKDIGHLYEIFAMLVMWLSAVFYDISNFSETVQRLALINPIFTHIHFMRSVILYGVVPEWYVFAICAAYAAAMLALGAFFYKRYNYKFLYYM
ncbi:MAG: ABC transporter permease [Defluviitaleaceae bacterium]|nr:ABC transporter permease [Defluviitaleaceae bacterium]